MFGKKIKWVVGELPASAEFRDLAEMSWFVFLDMEGNATFQSLNADRPMAVIAMFGSTVEYRRGEWAFDGNIVSTE